MLLYLIDNQPFFDAEKQDITLTISGDGIDADISDIRLLGDARDYILSKVNPTDIFKSLTFEVKYGNDTLYSGYFNFFNDHNLHPNCDYIGISVVRDASKAELEQIADNLTILGAIASGELQLHNLDYQLSGVPDRHAIGILLVSLLLSTYILQDATKEVIKDIAVATSNPFTINVALGIAIEVTYLGLNLLAITKLLKDLVKNTIPSQKTCEYYYLKDALRVLFQKVGLTYIEGVEAAENLAIIPSRNSDGSILTQWTLRDLVNLVKDYFNLELVVKDGKAFFVQIPQANNSIVLDYQLVSKRINLEACPNSILLRYAYDGGDANTTANGIGNSAQVIYNFKGNAKVIELPVARARRKDELLFVEKVLKEILQAIELAISAILAPINGAIAAINGVISLLNNIIRLLRKIGIRLNQINIEIKTIKPPDLSGIIEERVGNLLTESDTWGVEKIFVPDGDKINASNAAIVNAERVVDTFYSYRPVYEEVEFQTTICYDTFKQLSTADSVVIGNNLYYLIGIEYNLANSIAKVKAKRIIFADNSIPQKIVK